MNAWVSPLILGNYTQLTREGIYLSESLCFSARTDGLKKVWGSEGSVTLRGVVGKHSKARPQDSRL